MNSNIKIITAIFFILSASIISNTFARTVVVDCNGGGEFLTIQQGIDVVVDGDTVLVFPGTYSEGINFLGKGIVVKSKDGAENTIIDGGNWTKTLVTMGSTENDNTVLDGFTIQKGKEGVFIDGILGSPLIINNIITDNKYSVLIAIILRSMSPRIVANKIINNEEAIICFFSTPLIQDNLIANNTCYAAIYLNYMPSCVYDRNKNFTFGNITKGQYKAYIINNTIINNNTRNTIETYHAVSGFSVYIINNLICYNEASYRGAVILDVQDNYCFHNTIFGNSKSGVYYTQNNMVKNNIIACNGGYGIIGPGGYDHNDVWNNSLGNYQQGLPGQGDISKDPLFNDPDNNDFHLTAASPCINAGAFISGVTYDIDYDHRPYGAGFDMGADEYVPLLHIEATIK